MAKILKVLKNIVIGIFIFYVVVGFGVIPLILTWAIPSQGSKILKCPVSVRSVLFNPFLLQLEIKGFSIQNKQHQDLIGLDRLWVDVSFLGFFKKLIHIEAIDLKGLRVNVVLLKGGKINLLELVPASPVSSQAASPAPVAPGNNSQTMPNLLVDRITLKEGQIHFEDQTIEPNFSTTLGAMELDVRHISTKPQEQAEIKFQAFLDGKGKISMQASVKPFLQPPEFQTSLSINNYIMTILTPYVGKYTGHKLQDGKLDLNVNYRLEANKLNAGHDLLIQHFTFGSKVESKDALPLPFGLAVGLLEDAQGKIKISLPVTGDLNDPKFEYFHLVGQVAHNFFMKLITKPFTFLASIIGKEDSGTDELGSVHFLPGRADLSDQEKQKLLDLMKGLKERPRLRLEIPGSYDPKLDWKAIQADIFTKDYNELRKHSSRSDAKVYEQLYQRRFGIRALWALAKKYKSGIGAYDDLKLSQEIKRQLIENAPPDEGALGVLGQARAQAIYDILSTSLDANHLNISRSHAIESRMGHVPLDFTLTLFESSSQ